MFVSRKFNRVQRKAKRIALVGNMNNNHFAVMRYFRDLGADAHLLPFANDGQGSVSHFRPENDTWDIRKWSPYIHQLDIDNGSPSIIGRPKLLRFPPTKRRLQEIFSGYDAFVGTGMAPAIFARCGKDLDIFSPYAVGIEWIGCLEDQVYLEGSPFVKRLFLKYIRRKQISGVRRARFCIAGDLSVSKDTFEKIGKEFLPLATPMVYNREFLDHELLSEDLLKLTDELRVFDFKVLSHARHAWHDDTCSAHGISSKHNDWLVRGYAEFLKKSPETKSVLLLFEVGLDVGATKRLCLELGIEKNIMWLPTMPRKELMYVLSLCDMGVGEFMTEKGLLWGGTGWEVLASGRPLLQSFNFTDDEYRQTFGHEPPPILDAKSPEDIQAHFTMMLCEKDERIRMGNQSRAWFDRHNGIGLAKRWLDLLLEE